MVFCAPWTIKEKEQTSLTRFVHLIVSRVGGRPDPVHNVAHVLILRTQCTELDKIVPQQLHIAKSVLENVLFCHQEDASWPLQEGAVLKKRFDDIFDSTKYVKALEAFKKTEKDFANRVKEHMVDVARLQSHKHAAEGFRKELQEQMDEEEAVDREKKDYANKLAEVEETIKKYGDIYRQYEEACEEIRQLENKLNMIRAALAKQQKMVERDMTEEHSLQEIQEMLDKFDEKMANQKQEEEAFVANESEIKSKIAALHKQEMELNGRIGKLEAEKDAHDKNLAEQRNIIERIIQQHNIELITQTQQSIGNMSFIGSVAGSQIRESLGSQDSNQGIPTEDMESIMRAFQKKESELRRAFDRQKEESARKQQELSRVLSKYDSEKQRYEAGRYTFWYGLCALRYTGWSDTASCFISKTHKSVAKNVR